MSEDGGEVTSINPSLCFHILLPKNSMVFEKIQGKNLWILKKILPKLELSDTSYPGELPYISQSPVSRLMAAKKFQFPLAREASFEFPKIFCY